MGVTFHKGSATEIQLLPQNCCTALAILKFFGKGSLKGRTLFSKRFFPSNTAVYLSFTIIDVLFRFRFETNNQNRVIIKADFRRRSSEDFTPMVSSARQ